MPTSTHHHHHRTRFCKALRRTLGAVTQGVPVAPVRVPMLGIGACCRQPHHVLMPVTSAGNACAMPVPGDGAQFRKECCRLRRWTPDAGSGAGAGGV
jgi:hypothetical protein